MPNESKSIGMPSFNHWISPRGDASNRHESLTGCPSRIEYEAFNGSVKRGSYSDDEEFISKTRDNHPNGFVLFLVYKRKRDWSKQSNDVSLELTTHVSISTSQGDLRREEKKMKKTIPQRSTFCTEDEGVIITNNDWMSRIFFFFFFFFFLTGPGLKYPDNTEFLFELFFPSSSSSSSSSLTSSPSSHSYGLHLTRKSSIQLKSSSTSKSKTKRNWWLYHVEIIIINFLLS